MNKKKLEIALNDMDDRYIEEAMTFKRASVISFRKAVSIAAVAAAVLIIGSVGVAAVVRAKQLRKVTVETQSMSVGVKPSERIDQTDSTEYVIDQRYPDETYLGDENTEWVEKRVITNDGMREEIYVYDDLSKALKGYKSSFYMDEFKGELVTAEVTKVYDDEWIFLDKSLFIQFRYGGGDVVINDSHGEVNYFELGLVGETENPREYVNSNGISFTIVDDSGIEGTSYVLISYDNHTGFIWFLDMDDDQIHDVLDLINID